jgi:hypothetical protein
MLSSDWGELSAGMAGLRRKSSVASRLQGSHGEESRVLNRRGGGARPVAASRPAIAYSRVDTGGSRSAVPSSSNFPVSHSGLEHGLIAQSC